MSLHSPVCACRMPHNKNNNINNKTTAAAATAIIATEIVIVKGNSSKWQVFVAQVWPGWLVLAASNSSKRKACNQLLRGVDLHLKLPQCVQPELTYVFTHVLMQAAHLEVRVDVPQTGPLPASVTACASRKGV